MGVLRSLIIKEIRQFRRNPFMPKLVVMFPIAIVLVMPWITTMDVKDVSVGIVDYDGSDVSHKIISCIDASEYLELNSIYQDYPSALEDMEDGRVDAILEIPDGFGRSILSKPEKLSVWSNGVNSLKGSLGSQYLMQTVIQCLKDIRSSKGLQIPEGLIETTNLYNPTMDYKHFMIPALMIMLLVMIGGFLPALNLVSEKELGTIEQINVTPVNRFVFTLSKLIPFWIICFIDLGLCMTLALLVYGLPVAGSVWAIFLAAALFIIVMSSVGVMIANLSDTMQQTMFIMLFVVLSFILISGLMTPVESMPEWAQKVTWFLPPTYIIKIFRIVYLKGASVAELWTDYAALAGFAVLFCILAAMTYKKRG